MTRKPPNFEWIGFTGAQKRLLNLLDRLGNNSWAQDSAHMDVVMPVLMRELHQAGLSLGQVIEAMRAIGYSWGALHQLERWESKRTTGNFGR